MKIMLLTASCSRSAGGLFPTITSLSKSLKSIGVQIYVVGSNDKYSEEDEIEFGNVPVCYYQRDGFELLKVFGYSKDIHKLIEDIRPDIIHLQGLWMYHSYAALKYKKRHSECKIIIEPHGMLDPWAVRNSAWKKKIVGWIFEYRNLRTADCIHALCQSEYESIRQFGLKNPIAIIPNGITLPVAPQFRRTHAKKILLYIGRIHPKKGLKEIIEGLIMLKDNDSSLFNRWTLRIAGWDQSRHIEKLKELVRNANLTADVNFIGPVYGKEKEQELCEANAFILSSFSEGLPMSVLEAWAYKLPVIMTDFCNIPEGFENGAAFRVEPNVDSLYKGLQEFLSKSDSELTIMGNNGYELVSKHFTWRHIAEQSAQLYKYLLADGSKPEFVYE